MTEENRSPSRRNGADAVISRRDVLIVTGASVTLAGVSTRGARAASATAPIEQSSAPAIVTRLVVNEMEHTLEIDARQSILDVLRERLELTGTKKGCNQGACGACTVLLDGKRVNSCLTLAVMHDGAAITTIEALKQGDTLHPLQAAFIENEGFQCGYCTSGQIMSGVACIAEGHALSLDDIRFWMSGNICRCGAYPGICAAVHAAAQDA
jgi:xanthine dehydrogenase YagT iron-sulfur-binding subunit